MSWRRNLELAGAVLALAAGAAPAQGGDRELGRHLAAECQICHRATGRAAGVPSIDGRPEVDIAAALQAFRDGRRANSTMQIVAGSLSDEDIAALATYFGAVTPSAPPKGRDERESR